MRFLIGTALVLDGVAAEGPVGVEDVAGAAAGASEGVVAAGDTEGVGAGSL